MSAMNSRQRRKSPPAEKPAKVLIQTAATPNITSSALVLKRGMTDNVTPNWVLGIRQCAAAVILSGVKRSEESGVARILRSPSLPQDDISGIRYVTIRRMSNHRKM